MHIYVPKTGGQRQNWRRMVIFGYTVSSKVSLSCSGKTISKHWGPSTVPPHCAFYIERWCGSRVLGLKWSVQRPQQGGPRVVVLPPVWVSSLDSQV